MFLPGLVSVTFRKLSPREIVALVRRAGLTGIEWGGDIHAPHGDLARAREVRAATLDAGLRVAAYGSYYRAGWSERNGLPFARVLDTAAASANTDTAARQAVTEDLIRISSAASEAGISVSTEFHGDTLTDTNESALRLLREVAHPGFFTCWQPHNGEATEECAAGLRALLPRVGNVHVFHWWPTAAERRPLSEGAARWAEFLRELAALPGERFALLEFVRDDSEAAFLRDAATLLSWLRDLRSPR
jgi:3-dehydroshikimate dehydratase